MLYNKKDTNEEKIVKLNKEGQNGNHIGAKWWKWIMFQPIGDCFYQSSGAKWLHMAEQCEC